MFFNATSLSTLESHLKKTYKKGHRFFFSYFIEDPNHAEHYRQYLFYDTFLDHMNIAIEPLFDQKVFITSINDLPNYNVKKQSENSNFSVIKISKCHKTRREKLHIFVQKWPDIAPGGKMRYFLPRWAGIFFVFQHHSLIALSKFNLS